MEPVTGWLCDRFGPKGIILSGICLLCACLLLMSVVNSRWAYYIIWAVIIGIGNTIGLTIAQDKTLTERIYLNKED
jgi:MFS family permease